MVKGGREASLEPRQHLRLQSRPWLRRKGGWSLADREGPKHMLRSAPGSEIWGQGFLWKPQGTFLLLKARAFSHPGPSSLSMSSLPASCLQCLCEAFTQGVTVPQEAEVKALSDQGHPLSSLHCASPGPRHYKVWRLRLCLSPWEDAAFLLGRKVHANCLSNMAERPTQKPVKVPSQQALPARQRAWQ